METSGSSFLHQRNPNLHNSPEVEGVVDYLRASGEKIPNEPAQKIENYLGFLANNNYVNDGILNGDESSIDRQVNQAIIVEASDIPNGYFDLQRQIAREAGHGDIAITDSLRNEAAKVVSADQRHSLKAWAEYISGNEDYPNWFKTYAFDGVTKLGKFDKEKGEFLKRSSGTTVPYPEVGRGALSQLYTWVKEAKVDKLPVVGLHGDPETAEYDAEKEKQFQKSLRAGKFDKLYVSALEAVNEGSISDEERQRIAGSWRTYAQNSDPASLHADLQGFGLDWCTATGFETTKRHLAGGDFMVYYSRDENAQDTVPRIAVRMQGGKVAEVRGINKNQEMEPELADTAAERVKGLPGGEAYFQKAEDMKRLTALDKRLADDPSVPLTKNEIRFLYEYDRPIQGFGYKDDPRIEKILTKRDYIADAATVYDTDAADKLATFEAILNDHTREGYGPWRDVSDVIASSKNLSPDVAQWLLENPDPQYASVLKRHIGSFRGLDDNMAQKLLPYIRGIDVDSFTGLSEKTFYELLDEFKKKKFNVQDQNALHGLLNRIDHFTFEDPQRFVEDMIENGNAYHVVARIEKFPGVDRQKIADIVMARGDGVSALASKIKAFPGVDHHAVAEKLLATHPRALVSYLDNLDVNKSDYARKLIAAGHLNDFVTGFGKTDIFDDDVASQIEAAHIERDERLKALREKEEQDRIRQEEEWAAEEHIHEEDYNIDYEY